MTRRLLPPTEWPRLAGTALEDVWELLPTDRASVLVVEDGARIVGCWAFLTVLHAEGVWIDPSCRERGVVGRHLIQGMHRIAEREHAKAVWTGSENAEIDALCRKLGAQEVPFKSWVIPMTKGES